MTYSKPVKKKKAPKKLKAQSKKRKPNMVRKLDRLFSVYLILKEGKCICCGTTKNLTTGHFKPKGVTGHCMRWEPINAHVQCNRCNLIHSYDATVYTQVMIHNFGPDIVADINFLYRDKRRFEVNYEAEYNTLWSLLFEITRDPMCDIKALKAKSITAAVEELGG